MGAALNALFDKARLAGGIPATIRLARLSRMSSIEAKTMEDTQENIDKVQKNLNVILAEFGDKDKQDGNEKTTTSDNTDINTVKKLRNIIQLFADFTSTKDIYDIDAEEIAKRITPALSEAIDVNRASIWLYNEDQTAIECLDLYEKNEDKHSSGVVLSNTDFPNYFKMIASSKTLSAEDAHTHPGTAEFSASYLTPLGINSMLDVPIFAHGHMIGVVCHEHTGPKRKWTVDEENFAYLMGNLIGMNIERSGGVNKAA